MTDHYYQTTLLLGGNEGDVQTIFSQAIDLLEQEFGLLLKKSALYRSPAWGFEATNQFINQAVILKSTLMPDKQLECCLQIEAKLGRIRDERIGYQSRVIDIDILFIDEQCIDTETLAVPHPLIAQRRFALLPLNEIMPQFIHPQFKISIQAMLLACTDCAQVEKL